MLLNSCNQKVNIEYPCAWVYKVIGPDKGIIKNAVKEVMQERQCSVTLSNKSSGGKYYSLNVEIEVYSEEDRNLNYEALKKHPDIKMVL